MIISHRLKRAWERARTNRQLRSYYQSLSGKSGVEKYLLGILLFILGSFYILFNSATLGQSLPQVFLLFLVIVTGWRIMTVRETARLRRLCQERIGEAEFKKRLERTSPAQVLQYLGEKAADSFGAIDLVLQEEKLVGSYQGEKIAIFYQYLEADEVLSTQEMIVMLRWCRQQEIPQARIFVNTDITPKAKGLGERFNLNLRTFNGQQLLAFLRDSPLYPDFHEIDTIIRKESAKRMRRLSVISREAVQGNKYSAYMIYGGVLLGMAWFKIGFVFWNVFFGLVLLFMAILSLIRSRPKTEGDMPF